jgi:hypothetical protein
MQINICVNIRSKKSRPAETCDVSGVMVYSTGDVLSDIVVGNMFVGLECVRMKKRGL